MAAVEPWGPRWLFGPWTKWVRDVTDLLRLAFLIAIPVVLAFGPRAEGLRLFLTLIVCLIPRALHVPRAFDLGFTAAMSLQAWGNVTNLFDVWLPYHDIVHCLLTMATAALFYIMLVRLRLVSDLAERRGIHEHLGMAVLVFAIGSVIGAVYEEYEWFAINVLHARLTEYYEHDIHDLLFNALGSLIAGGLLILWARRGWTTRRPDDDDPLGGLLRGFERRIAHVDRRRGAGKPRLRSRPLPRWMGGDWAPSLRDPLDLLRLSFAAGALLSAAQSDWEMALRFALTFAAAMLARVADLPRFFDAVWLAVLAFEAWGDYAGAFRSVPGYLQWTYFAFAAASAPVLYLVLIRLDVFPVFERDRGVHRRVATFLAAMCLGYCVGIYYDVYIWFANHVLGASFPVSWDGLTLKLALQWVGAVAGALVLLVWDTAGWANRRGLPAAVGQAVRGQRANS